MQNQIYPSVVTNANQYPSQVMMQPLSQKNIPSAPPSFSANISQPNLNNSYYTTPHIVINNNTNGLLGSIDHENREWSNELCNCFSDVGECCFAFFCPICYQIKIFIDAGETCCSWCFGGLVPLRTKIRTRNKIKGSICSDYCTLMWCGFCATVQMGIELKNTKITI
ncbi:unnamed protein product [Brachionus calyciflorus]|uniref:Cornifelin n=1 Tax=Brachionus calyciflorus TaxID=104777 RepID=A0A813TLV4_9BILA|nr:unnamed protein product [Brachionus calyciflorus]